MFIEKQRQMSAPEGNQFWAIRSSHGREKLFSSGEELWKAACEYFEWIEENPLEESQAFAYKGDIMLQPVPKMRPFVMSGFLRYAGVSENWVQNFIYESKGTKDPLRLEILEVIEKIKQVIYDQKFEGAASGLMNANFIARDLGLTDKKELSGEIKTSDAVDLSALTEEELDTYYALARKSTKKD